VASGLLTLGLARGLPPSVFAAWTLFLVVVAYANHAHLGLIFGAQQLIPRLGGPGASGRGRAIHDTAWIAIALPSAAFALAGSFLWCRSTECGDGILLVAVGLSLFAQPLLGFVQASLRLKSRFTLMSLIGVISYAGPALGVALYWLLTRSITVESAVMSTMVFSIAGLAVASRDIGLPRIFDRSALREVALQGLGPLAIGILLILLINVDVWVLQAKLGRAAVGEWGIGLSVLSVSLSGVAAFSNVLYPTIVREHGTSGPRIELSRWIIVLASLSVGWLLFMGLAAGPILRLVLPSYLAALSPAIFLAGVGLQLGLLSFSSNVLLAQRRYVSVAAVFAAAVAANAVVDVLAVGWGSAVLALTKLTLVSALGIVFSILAGPGRPELRSAWLASLSIYVAGLIAFLLTQAGIS